MPRTVDPGPDQPTVFFTRGTDRRLTGGYTQVPNCVLRSRTLSSGAKVLYGVLLSYAWQDGACHPDQTTMAADLGCTDRQVRNWLKELEEERLIQIHRRGLQRSNLYEIMPIPDRKNISGQDRKHISALERNQGSAPPEKDPGEKDSTVIVKAVSGRDSANLAPDDDVCPAGGEVGGRGVGNAVEELQTLVKGLAPKAVPPAPDAATFIQMHGSLTAAMAAVRGAASRHARTRKSDPIASWQFFLAAAERQAAPTVLRADPCKACAGRGFLFDDRGDLAACTVCRGSGIQVQAGRVRREPSLPASSPSG